MKIYLAGRISGDPEYRKKFRAAARRLERSLGGAVLSPAELPEGMSKTDYMQICFAELGRADMAAFLADYKDSPGAMLERQYCEYVGIPVIDLP